MQKKFRKGGGEFIGFAIGMIFLCGILVAIINIFFVARTSNQLENSVDLIARKLVTEESLEDAQKSAQKYAEAVLKDYMVVIKKDSVKAEVSYTPGSDKEWKKGNFINVYITVELVPSHKKRTVSAMVMIERDGS